MEMKIQTKEDESKEKLGYTYRQKRTKVNRNGDRDTNKRGRE